MTKIFCSTEEEELRRKENDFFGEGKYLVQEERQKRKVGGQILEQRIFLSEKETEKGGKDV